MRESEEVSSTYSQHNALNQLKQIGGAGTTLVEGLVDEPAFVKVNQAATSCLENKLQSTRATTRLPSKRPMLLAIAQATLTQS